MRNRDFHPIALALASLLVMALPTAARAQNGPGVREMTLVNQGRSRALRAYQTRNRATPVINKAVRTHRPTSRIDAHRPSIGLPDPIRQENADPTGLQQTPTGFGFAGLSDDDNAAVAGVRVVPPDIQGDVGPDQYIQMINVIFAVFDKETGEIVNGGGPFPNNVLWEGFGGPCEAQNDGDPIVLYDHLADRWVFSQFAVPGYQCFAVSATSDPLGEYHLYQFLVSPGDFFGIFPDINDYPKIGVWPDAYYMTFNEFSGLTGGFNGAVAAAFPRQAMLDGLGATGVRTEPLDCSSECFFSLQPSHLEGPPPPPGTPNTFVMAFDDQAWGTGTGTDGYRLWEFAVNWADLNASTFTPLAQVDTVPFDAILCGGARDCIPQPAPGERVDSLSVFTMYRAQYRNFGTHETLLVNHTVNAGNEVAGIRWAELQRTGGQGGWTLYQTGTYAPNDGIHRWMGSIAMDDKGNIGLGYSASSEVELPSVRYTSRSAGDPPGVMAGGEQVMVQGDLVQTASSNRWGDYSAMSIDPADGCTFWYTQEYQANDFDGQTDFDFKTWIGSFRLPDCGDAVDTPPVVTITAPPTGSNYTVEDEVVLTATANDNEDGGLDDSLTWISSIDGDLGMGGTVTTTALSVGTHTITASVTDLGGNSASDEITIVVQSASSPPAGMHVASVTAETVNLGGGRKQGLATIVIQDENGGPVSGATVTGDFTGTFNETHSASTDMNGTVQILTSSTARRGVDVAFCVTDVSDSNLAYDPDANVVTCSFDSSGGPTVTITEPQTGMSFSDEDPVTFTASATDAGGGDVSDSVVWSEGSVDLASGPTFTTSALAIGSHTVTATATDAAGRTGSDQVTVEIFSNSAATSMRVLSITTGTLNAGQGNKYGTARVAIVDDLNAPVPGVTVSGEFSGTLTGPDTAITGSDGTATLLTPGTAKGSISVSFCVTDVTGGSLPFNSGASVGICPMP